VHYPDIVATVGDTLVFNYTLMHDVSTRWPCTTTHRAFRSHAAHPLSAVPSPMAVGLFWQRGQAALTLPARPR
jgi:hypothetical protein